MSLDFVLPMCNVSCQVVSERTLAVPVAIPHDAEPVSMALASNQLSGSVCGNLVAFHKKVSTSSNGTQVITIAITDDTVMAEVSFWRWLLSS